MTVIDWRNNQNEKPATGRIVLLKYTEQHEGFLPHECLSGHLWFWEWDTRKWWTADSNYTMCKPDLHVTFWSYADEEKHS